MLLKYAKFRPKILRMTKKRKKRRRKKLTQRQRLSRGLAEDWTSKISNFNLAQHGPILPSVKAPIWLKLPVSQTR